MTSGQIQLPRKLVEVFSGEALIAVLMGVVVPPNPDPLPRWRRCMGLGAPRPSNRGSLFVVENFKTRLMKARWRKLSKRLKANPGSLRTMRLARSTLEPKTDALTLPLLVLRRNIESVKSTARIRLLWVDEAEPVSEVAWQKAIPTVREEGAEIWVTWNPERRASATNQRFRINPPLD